MKQSDWGLVTRKRGFGFVAMAMAAVAVLSVHAKADLLLQVAENGGPLVTVATTIGSPAAVGGVTAVSSSAATPHYIITVLAANEKQTASFSELTTSTLSITKVDNSVTTLNIVTTGTGFTAPTTPPSVGVNSQISGTIVVTGASNTLSFQSLVAGVGQTVQNPDITAPAAFANTSNTLVASLAAPFAISQQFNLFLAAPGDQLGLHATTELTGVVPSPSSGLIGFVSLVLVALHRRTPP